MYSNKILNFQESTIILNAHTKNVWKLIESVFYHKPIKWGSDNNVPESLNKYGSRLLNLFPEKKEYRGSALLDCNIWLLKNSIPFNGLDN